MTIVNIDGSNDLQQVSVELSVQGQGYLLLVSSIVVLLQMTLNLFIKECLYRLIQTPLRRLELAIVTVNVHVHDTEPEVVFVWNRPYAGIWVHYLLLTIRW